MIARAFFVAFVLAVSSLPRDAAANDARYGLAWLKLPFSLLHRKTHLPAMPNVGIGQKNLRAGRHVA